MKNPYLARSRPYPLKMLVDIHSQCNARCTMCPYPRYARVQEQGVMPWEGYRAIVAELGRLGRRYHYRPQLSYCYMGEPFLADDLSRYVRCALEQGIGVYLNTNGSPMTPAKVDALLETGFDGLVHISVHGASADTYQRITGLDYERTLSHIDYLLERYRPDHVVIRGVDDGWPDGEVARWHAFWKPRGVRTEYLKPISRCGSVRRLFRPADPSRGPTRLYGCQYNHPLVEMVVLFNGQAVMCCQDMGREISWGNVIQDGIEAVWNGPVRRRLIEKLYNGEPLEGDFLCRRCEQALRLGGMAQNLLYDSMRKTGHLMRRTVRSLAGAKS